MLLSNFFRKGLFALFITAFFTTNLFSKYLYKDEVIKNPDFSFEVEKIGKELYEKTNISLYLIMLRELEDNQTISDVEKSIASKVKEPAIFLTFVEVDQKVDILVRPASLYKDFDKKQILSPSASLFGGVVNAILFSRSFDDAMELITTTGGVILPILGQRAKGKDIVSKYSVAMFNGYAEIAEQVAAHYNVTLDSAVGNSNKNVLFYLELLFFAVIFYALGKFLYLRITRKKGDSMKRYNTLDDDLEVNSDKESSNGKQ